VDRLLARLERHYGKLAIENLTVIIVGGMALVFFAEQVRPDFAGLLMLDLPLVGPPSWQVWRLFTYLFLPPPGAWFGMIFELYFLWLVGTGLDREWGSFKFNAYYVVGMIGTTIAAAITGGAQGNFFLNLSLLLGFATLFPDFQLLLFLVLPVKVKWLALLDAGMMAYAFVQGSSGTRAAIAASLANYFLFFGGHLWGMWRGRNLQVRQAARRASMGSAPAATGGRVCAICGAREDDGADIRVCSCEKCEGKPRTLCLEHARNH
jgi:membrane associated rhomboid family serine protease